MSKRKSASWWKMMYHQRNAINSVSDADAGLGLKAAFAYFDGEEVEADQLTAGAFTVFCVIQPYLDESLSEYQKTVDNGKSGASKRWNKPENE